jgi:hypothetical protein
MSFMISLAGVATRLSGNSCVSEVPNESVLQSGVQKISRNPSCTRFLVHIS